MFGIENAPWGTLVVLRKVGAGVCWCAEEDEEGTFWFVFAA